MILAIFCPIDYKCPQRVLRKIDHLTKNSQLKRLLLVGGSAVVQQSVLSNFGNMAVLSAEEGTSLATHAIIFGDGFELFPRLPNLDSRKIRFIYTPITRVVNVNRLPENLNTEYMTYVGRGTPFGNPHPIQETGSRVKSIDFFKYDFERGFLGDGNIKLLATQALLGRYLGCSCKPLRCHGDVLAEYLNSIDIDEINSELKKQCWFYEFGIPICRGSHVRE
ncbi:DUF4326 domain-containing protein [Vibrio coralliirubri]|uniref:DUF4326 domain-containing protein n=1 Tax=Vibrio coralliirubri TaxID=1516159 RepID=UPI003B9832D6